MGAGGSTTFSFVNGQVTGWRMTVQGSTARVLDSSIPHEVNHTIFASVFRRPLPRWADEGAAVLVEHQSEKAIQRQALRQVWRSRYSLRRLFPMMEYPGGNKTMALYSQGAFVTQYLVSMRGRRTFLSFLEQAHRDGWDKAVTTHYGFRDVTHLDQVWSRWVEAGMRPVRRRSMQIMYQCGPFGCRIVPMYRAPPVSPPTWPPTQTNPAVTYTEPGSLPGPPAPKPPGFDPSNLQAQIDSLQKQIVFLTEQLEKRSATGAAGATGLTGSDGPTGPVGKQGIPGPTRTITVIFQDPKGNQFEGIKPVVVTPEDEGIVRVPIDRFIVK